MNNFQLFVLIDDFIKRYFSNIKLKIINCDYYLKFKDENINSSLIIKKAGHSTVISFEINSSRYCKNFYETVLNVQKDYGRYGSWGIFDLEFKNINLYCDIKSRIEKFSMSDNASYLINNDFKSYGILPHIKYTKDIDNISVYLPNNLDFKWLSYDKENLDIKVINALQKFKNTEWMNL